MRDIRWTLLRIKQHRKSIVSIYFICRGKDKVIRGFIAAVKIIYTVYVVSVIIGFYSWKAYAQDDKNKSVEVIQAKEIRIPSGVVDVLKIKVEEDGLGRKAYTNIAYVYNTNSISIGDVIVLKDLNFTVNRIIAHKHNASSRIKDHITSVSGDTKCIIFDVAWTF